MTPEEFKDVQEATRDYILRRMRDDMPSAVQKKASYLQGWKAAMAAAERAL